ncbi:MAG: tetratricopeptide repeat protein [Cyclobacteriaceae bacterium]|jgi:tetratricopeptide (TPR) repeat protein|nr:tetratricopeptide repeat protein [Cyclobacteriaceae bacterium]
MKKLVFVLAMIASVAAVGQKPIKPNISKAEKDLKAGKLDEAKAVIDATVVAPEVMESKKGGPSKDAAKAWYVKGMIYAALDTTKEAKFKSLEPNAFNIAKESFEKAMQIDGGKSKSFVQLPDPAIGFPRDFTFDEVSRKYADHYYMKAANVYEQDKDYARAFEEIKKVVYFIPNDTSILFNAGVFFASAAKDYDASADYIQKYFASGGKQIDAYRQLIAVYASQKKNEEALKAVREAAAKFPNESEFAQSEIALLYDMGRLPEARASLEAKAGTGKADRATYYNLGVICLKLNDQPAAEKAFNEAIKLDKDDFDSYAQLADLKYKEVRKVRDARNDIAGKNDAEIKKRQELFQQIKTKLLEALPYWEKCEQLKPSEESVLYGLLSVYGELSAYDEAYEAKSKKLAAKMKSLGLEVD